MKKNLWALLLASALAFAHGGVDAQAFTSPIPAKDLIDFFKKTQFASTVDPAALEEAAKNGDAASQFRLSSLYIIGHEVAKNKAQGQQWLQQSAQQGYALAQTTLGTLGFVELFLSSRSVPNIESPASLWLHKAAEQQEPYAQFFLALIYADSQNTPNYAEAIRYLRECAEQNDNIEVKAMALMSLFVAHTQGKGVPKISEKEALPWLQKAAEQGDSQAQKLLADLYAYDESLNMSGEGEDKIVQRNLPEAFYWYYQAANQNISSTQYAVGYFYLTGVGVEQDYLQAYKWFNLALSKEGSQQRFNQDDSPFLPKIEESLKAAKENLPPKKIIQANQEIAAWKTSYQKKILEKLDRNFDNTAMHSILGSLMLERQNSKPKASKK